MENIFQIKWNLHSIKYELRFTKTLHLRQKALCFTTGLYQQLKFKQHLVPWTVSSRGPCGLFAFLRNNNNNNNDNKNNNNNDNNNYINNNSNNDNSNNNNI